ncbi:MAG TPA: hypothetical protein VF699_07435 [Caulobacteraceae bacterium]|jgi:hypothetical protein
MSRACAAVVAVLLCGGCTTARETAEEVSLAPAPYTMNIPHDRLPLTVSSRGLREITADFDGDRTPDTAALFVERLSGRIELWVKMGNGHGGALDAGRPEPRARETVLHLLLAGGEPTCPPHPTRTCSPRPTPSWHGPFILVTRPDGGQHLWGWAGSGFGDGFFVRREVFP